MIPKLSLPKILVTQAHAKMEEHVQQQVLEMGLSVSALLTMRELLVAPKKVRIKFYLYPAL